jgi:membrane-associated protease RseP (regulator of RpoE activity)
VVSDRAFEKQARWIAQLVGDLFEIEACYAQHERLVFSLGPRLELSRSRAFLEDRLRSAGYRYTLSPSGESLLLTIDPKRRLEIPRLNVVLFLITLASVYVVPVFLLNLNAESLRQALSQTLADLARGEGIEFTMALMSILLVHEMGHFIASRRRGIVTSWPYFIPAPNIIGTFGAVIKSKSPFWNRRDLIEVGSAGPIAGWIIAFGWLIFGLSRSYIVPSDFSGEAGLLFSLEGESILIKWLVPLLVGTAPEGSWYIFTEAAFAGWVGLLVTAINMLPIGQLDGGHVLYGLARRRQRVLGWLAMAALLIMGIQSTLWWVFAGMGFIFGVAHPPTMDDRRALSWIARVMGWAALLILLLSFTPVPFQ